MLTKYDIINKLNNNKVKYELFEHEPFYTVKDSYEKRGSIPGSHTKNLFLKNKKNQFVLFSCDEAADIKIKDFSKSIGFNNLSFAKENYLKDLLGILPGSVSPFALLNDEKNMVNFYLDSNIYDSEFISFHPLTNNSTINLRTSDFIAFMIENKKNINIYSLNTNKIIKKYD